MGLFVGNFLGLLAIAFAIGFGHESLEKASQLFVCIAYGVWLVFLATDFMTRPGKDSLFLHSLEPEEQAVYRRYHTAIDFPIVAQVYAGILNFLRVSGLVWAGLCAWHELWFLAVTTFLLFILSASLIHRYHPWLFLGQQVNKGHPRAEAEWPLLQKVFMIRHGQQENTDEKTEP